MEKKVKEFQILKNNLIPWGRRLVMNVLINEARIAKRLYEMAKKIDEDYKWKEIVLIGILKGSVVFMVEIAKRLKSKVQF